MESGVSMVPVEMLVGATYPFTTPNYPHGYPPYEHIEWNFRAPTDGALTLVCVDIQLSWFTHMYVTDGNITHRLSCYDCALPMSFSHEFSSPDAVVGLHNKLFFTAPGFNCTMRVSQAAPDCSCGLTVKNRIVGGTETDPLQYPWMAGISLMGSTWIFCGGSLITDRHILTAAHCTRYILTAAHCTRYILTAAHCTRYILTAAHCTRYILTAAHCTRYILTAAHCTRYILTAAHCTRNLTANQMGVSLGLHHTSNQPLFRSPVLQLIDHPAYDGDYMLNDISVLRIRPVDFSEEFRIRPICLPSGSGSYAERLGIVIGWGTTTYEGFMSHVLLEVRQRVVSNEQCKRYYGSQIVDSMLCAGGLWGEDACQ
ncbi:Serine proteases trypsin domain, partial [Trinorchestia longiramus]